MATLKQRMHKKNSSGTYDTVHLETSSSLVLRPSGRTVEQDLADYLPKTQASDTPPSTLKSASLVTGLTKIWAGVNDTVTELATAGASLPSGLIAIWKGSTSTIPDGWVLCDGQNGTPNLRDKFVLGAGNSYGVGNTGGERTHTLTVNEMPSHNHSSSESSIRIPLNDRSGGSSAIFGETAKYSANGIDIDVSVNIGYTGGGSAHNNMPPYYTLCYIMKT